MTTSVWELCEMYLQKGMQNMSEIYKGELYRKANIYFVLSIFKL